MARKLLQAAEEPALSQTIGESLPEKAECPMWFTERRSSRQP
jgi:hypothetical protein